MYSKVYTRKDAVAVLVRLLVFDPSEQRLTKMIHEKDKIISNCKQKHTRRGVSLFYCFFQLRKLRMFFRGSSMAPSKTRWREASLSGVWYEAKKRSMVSDSWCSCV